MVAQNFDSVVAQLAAIEEIIAGADKSAAARARIESGRILAQQRGARKAIPQALQKRLSTELTITAHTVETRIAAAAEVDDVEPAAAPDADVPGAEVVEPAAEIDAGAERDTVVGAEIVEALNEDAARRLTDLIRTGMDDLWDLIIRAWNGRAWVALGYPNWDTYCDSEFHPGRLRLPREQRRDVVVSMREAGMSIRAISAGTGISDQTVQRDLSVVNHYTSDVTSDVTPPPPSMITGTDGKRHPARKTPEQVAAAAEKRAASAKKKAATPPAAEGVADDERRAAVAAGYAAARKEFDDTAAAEPLMENFMIAISSKAAVVAVTFRGAEECVIIPLGGRLDKRITPDVAEQLWYHLRGAMPKIADLIEQLGRHAKKAV